MLGALVSEAISRSLTTHNFYDEVLAQDGIVLVHVIPPRDLRSWQAYPVSAIANFRPVVIDNLSPENLRAVLEKNQFKRFPVIDDGKVIGCLTREEMQRAIEGNRPPILEKVATCRRSFTHRRGGAIVDRGSRRVRGSGSRRQTGRHHHPARPAARAGNAGQAQHALIGRAHAFSGKRFFFRLVIQVRREPLLDLA